MNTLSFLKVFFFSIALCIVHNLSGQTVTIAEDSSYIGENSAILDVNSTNKGLLPPRLTSFERQAINNPAAGLIVYDTDVNQLFQFNGTLWEKLLTDSDINNIKSQINELQLMTGILIEDADGNIYNTVKIGNQRWMAENMRTTKTKGGLQISLITDNSAWANSSINMVYCWYDNDSINNSQYGALYNLEAAKVICPAGWHLPNVNEWLTLSSFLGLNSGGKLKEAGLSHWSAPNSGATNESGFTALPGGGRSSFNGAFVGLTTGAYFYTSSIEYLNYTPLLFELYFDNANVNTDDYPAGMGASVRCIKD